LLDAARLRKKGIDTIAVVWDIFEWAATTHAELQGVPGLPLVVVPQIAVGETEVHQRAKARVASKEIIERWQRH
jgi:hypothetical protein